MRKLAVLLWMILYPLFSLAQITTVQNSQDQNIDPPTIHEILFQDRTGITINKVPDNGDLTNHAHHMDYTFNPDTSWSYDEYMWQGDSAFNPSNFNQNFDLGNEMEFVRNGLNYTWESDSTRWVLQRKNLSWLKDAFKDSSKNYDVDENGDPLYGSFYIYSRTPSMGATEESFYQRYDQTLGWVKDSRFLYYSNEDETIRWGKNYSYIPDSADYQINNENLTEDLDTHFLYEYKSYSGGSISYWSKDFSLYNEDGTTVYSVDYSYNNLFSSLDPTDSTHYNYTEDYAEAFGYRWYRDFSEWELDNYTITYESESMNSPYGIKIDSIITREVYYDMDLDSIITGIILTKTEYTYDANDNLIESTYFAGSMNGLAPINRSTYEYELIDGKYLQTVSKNYMYSYSIMDLYLSSEFHNMFDEAGNYAGDMVFFFTDLGDTTSGSKSLVYLEDENYYSFRFNWDTFLHEFILSDFMVEEFAEPVSFFSYTSSEFGADRVMHVKNSLPAALNPGPLFISLNDTVEFTVIAFNPDMTIPEVSMTGIPASATFDPATRSFYWIADEEVAGPFFVTSTRGSKSTTVEVKVVFGEFTVGSEGETDLPVKVTLYQNYPNPFNPSTTIGFEISRPQNVTLQIFNILGQPVQTLINNELMTAGLKELPFNAHRLSSGVYYYRLVAGDEVLTKKMTLVK
jgi:hypothetical protein